MRLKELFQKIASQEIKDFDTFLEDFVPNTLCKNETLQQSFALTDQEMELLYQEGYSLYTSNLYEQAIDIFRWLVMLNPFVLKYWLGLGANQQLLQQYQKALKSYAIIAFFDKENPYPHFYAYQCYQALKEKEEAKKALLIAYTYATKNAAYTPLVKIISTLQNKEI